MCVRAFVIWETAIWNKSCRDALSKILFFLQERLEVFCFTTLSIIHYLSVFKYVHLPFATILSLFNSMMLSPTIRISWWTEETREMH